MTATQVTIPDKGTQKVIAVEPVVSPLSMDPENPMYFKQIVKLLLEDGSETYGCVHCDYTSDKVASVRPHLNKHGAGKVGRPRNDTPSLTKLINMYAELTLGDILELTDRGLVAEKDDASVRQRLTDERDDWKQRALAAEKKLKKIRDTFGSLVGDS